MTRGQGAQLLHKFMLSLLGSFAGCARCNDVGNGLEDWPGPLENCLSQAHVVFCEKFAIKLSPKVNEGDHRLKEDVVIVHVTGHLDTLLSIGDSMCMPNRNSDDVAVVLLENPRCVITKVVMETLHLRKTENFLIKAAVSQPSKGICEAQGVDNDPAGHVVRKIGKVHLDIEGCRRI